MNIFHPPRRQPATTDSPPRRRQGRRLPLILLMCLALIPLGGLLGIGRAALGITPGSSVYLETAQTVPYGGGGGSTNFFWVDGQIAYCSNPQTWTPYSGWYTKSSLELPASNTVYDVEDVRTILWFGYGGPGFDRSIWPQTDWDGSTITDAEYLAYTHVLLADRMWCDGGKALFGCTTAFNQWYAPRFLGYAWSGGPGPTPDFTPVVQQMEARRAEVPGSDEFDVYMIDTGYNANIGTGERSQTIITFAYHPKVTVTFTKTSADASITDGNAAYAYAGATYEIHRADDDWLVDTIVTDDEGKATLRLEPHCAYYAVETKAPAGFTCNPDRIAFDTGSTTQVDLSDQPGTFTLVIRKTDAVTQGEAQSGLGLADAQYELIDANGDSHTLTTDDEGRARVEGLPLGTCTVREVTAPEGYRLSEAVHTYTVSAEDLSAEGTYLLEATDSYAELPTAFDLDIVKYRESGNNGSGTQEPCSGVQFEIIAGTSDEVVATLTTDEAGRASTEGAWYGTGDNREGLSGALPYDRAGYTVREVPETTPEGYQPTPDWHITPEEMVDGVTLHYIVDNDFIGSRLQIVKTDADTGETLPLAGFSFQLLDRDKNPVSQQVWYPNPTETSVFTTDETGSVTLPQQLVPGTYYLRETETVAPYLASEEDILVSIPNDEHTPPITVITVPNRVATGHATIVKTCAGTNCSGPLEGAAFDIITQQDVISPTGAVLATAGNVVDHVTTDQDGRATTAELPLGTGEATYAFVETKPPAGHALDTTPHEFTLSYQDAQTPVVSTEVTVSNHPTTITLQKTDAATAQPVANARFRWWHADDEVTITPQAGYAALAVRADGAHEVSLHMQHAYATATAAVPDGWKLSLSSDAGITVLGDHDTTLSEGSYTVTLQDDAGATVELADQTACQIEPGLAYTFSYEPHIFGTGGAMSIEHEPMDAEAVQLAYDEQQDVWAACDVQAGIWKVSVDEADCGTVALEQGSAVTAAITDDTLVQEPLLMPDAESLELTSDETGRIYIGHLTPGTYRFQEIAAPDGYVRNTAVQSVTVDEAGTVDGKADTLIMLPNDFTKVDVSKRDLDTEQAVVGAELAVLDDHDTVIDSWTTTDEAHRIERLAPGTYRLVEMLAPQRYDTATEQTFTVTESTEVLRVVIYDKPIEVTGQVDKRQEIADPITDGMEADAPVEEGGSRRADVRVSEDGSFDYRVDLRSTASTWVDEFTLTDTFATSTLKAATFDGITTPIAAGDYDGKVNIWYTTTGGSPTAGNVDEAESAEQGDAEDEASEEAATRPETANATLEDGHENPWLSHPEVVERLGDDARAVSYDGWHLWRRDVDLSTATDLSVSELPLAPGEIVSGIRLEFGRVEPSFTTRADGWNRDDLKDEHDDIDPQAPSISDDAEQDQRTEHNDEEQLRAAPLVIHMKATKDYQPSAPLENTVQLDLYRNGGSLNDDEQLEDHDEDRVVQYPRERAPVEQPTLHLAQTGSAPFALIFTVLTGTIGCGAWMLQRKAHRLRLPDSKRHDRP